MLELSFLLRLFLIFSESIGALKDNVAIPIGTKQTNCVGLDGGDGWINMNQK